MNHKKIILSLFMLFMSAHLWAATFIPLSLEQMVTEATGGAEVILASKRAFQTPHGLIQTEHVFEVLESSNLEKNDLEGNYLKLVMMGGTLNGLTSYIDGGPEFKIGEKSFILLKRVQGQMYLSNFTMGKFDIEEIEGEVFYKSVVFPKSEELGKVKKNKMLEMLSLKNTVTRNPYPDQQVLENPADKGLEIQAKSFDKKERTPASNDFVSSTSFHLMSVFILCWLSVMCFSFYRSMGKK